MPIQTLQSSPSPVRFGFHGAGFPRLTPSGLTQSAIDHYDQISTLRHQNKALEERIKVLEKQLQSLNKPESQPTPEPSLPEKLHQHLETVEKTLTQLNSQINELKKQAKAP